MNRLKSSTTQLLRLLFLVCVAAMTQLVSGEDGSYASQWGPAIGTQLPELEVKGPDGESRSFDQLKGSNGLVLVFVRSSDW